MMDVVPRFAADRMLGRLARWLRLMGADVLYDSALPGAELLRLARDERRTLITRDKRLRTASDVLYLSSNSLRDQLLEVLRRHPFDPRLRALSRCSICNTELSAIEANAVADRVPPFVFASHDRFAICLKCGRIYWEATHVKRMLAEIGTLIEPGAPAS